MDLKDSTVKVKYAWWVKPYSALVITIAVLRGRKPDLLKLVSISMRGAKIQHKD